MKGAKGQGRNEPDIYTHLFKVAIRSLFQVSHRATGSHFLMQSWCECHLDCCSIIPFDLRGLALVQVITTGTEVCTKRHGSSEW